MDGYKIGDVCLYSFGNKNKSAAVVEIVKILDDLRGVAEVKFLKVIEDDTGNGFFEYLYNSSSSIMMECLKNSSSNAL